MKKSALIIFTFLLLILSSIIFGNMALGKNPDQKLPYENAILLSNNQDFDTSASQIRDSVYNAFKKYTMKKSGTYYVTDFVDYGEYYLGNIMPSIKDLEIENIEQAHEYQIENSIPITVKKKGNKWEVDFEDLRLKTKNNKKSIGEDLLGKLIPKTKAASIDKYHFRFPFTNTVGISLFRTPTVWHTGNSIDFAPDNNADVLAISNGYVSSVCKNSQGEQAWITIRPEDPNNDDTYLNAKQYMLHFDKNSIPAEIKAGKIVKQGDKLGRLVSSGNETNPNTYECAQWTTARHVHVQFTSRPVYIDGYTFTEKQTTSGATILKLLNSLNQEVAVNSTTKFYSTQSEAYNSNLWEIDSSYTVTGNIAAAGYVIVKNGATLTIKNNSSLDIDLQKYNLIVEPKGKVFIETGGKLF